MSDMTTCPHCGKPAAIKTTGRVPTYAPHNGGMGPCTWGAGTGIPISRRAEIPA